MSEKCTKCGNEDLYLVPFKQDKLCHECLEALLKEPVRCPFCGAEAAAESCLSILMCRPGASDAEKLAAPETYVNVCPVCHGLFMDEFQYTALKTHSFR